MARAYYPKKDWYECSKCKNQGYVEPNGTPDPKKWEGCKCEGQNFTGDHDWQKLADFQNAPTDIGKFPDQYFNISK